MDQKEFNQKLLEIDIEIQAVQKEWACLKSERNMLVKMCKEIIEKAEAAGHDYVEVPIGLEESMRINTEKYKIIVEKSANLRSRSNDLRMQMKLKPSKCGSLILRVRLWWIRWSSSRRKKTSRQA